MKKVESEMHFNPICWNTLRTLVADVPATSIPNESKKLPAGIIVPVIYG
jgi:hypothetical protein